MIDVSPQGITALVIEGIAPKVDFQHTVVAKSASAANTKVAGARHARFDVPTGQAQAMILSFGPKLTWLYVYLTADDEALQSATLRVFAGGKTTTLSDTTFPFEFSMPIPDDLTEFQLQVQAFLNDGTSAVHIPAVKMSLR
jgi:hypothetical protein